MSVRVVLASALLLAVLGATSCSVSGSVGTDAKVDSTTLEKQVADKLKNKLPPDSVACPDGLKAEVGATSTCTVVAHDLRYTATVTATGVDGTTVSFDLKMPPPAVVPSASLQEQITSAVHGRVPGGVKSVTCTGDLVGTVGETANCVVTSKSGQRTPVTVTVTTASFTNVQFDIKSHG